MAFWESCCLIDFLCLLWLLFFCFLLTLHGEKLNVIIFYMQFLPFRFSHFSATGCRITLHTAIRVMHFTDRCKYLEHWYHGSFKETRFSKLFPHHCQHFTLHLFSGVKRSNISVVWQKILLWIQMFWVNYDLHTHLNHVEASLAVQAILFFILFFQRILWYEKGKGAVLCWSFKYSILIVNCTK